jgi:predicted Rossmann-fold nucleotide-binding protein
MIEIDTLEKLRAHLKDHGTWRGVVVQGLDLSELVQELGCESVGGAVFLGCQLAPSTMAHIYNQGALVFPRLPDLPFDPYRPHLYTVEDLYEGFDPAQPESYQQTPDALIYQHWARNGRDDPDSILETLSRRLHDHAMSDAMGELLRNNGQPHKVIAIMGGHGLTRTSESYRKAVFIARALSREGFLLASGGGPGAMEATHLGAWLAPRPDEALDEALSLLACAPSYKDEGWLSAAFAVRERFPLSPEEAARHPSLGIPTWLYGHEPPNAFATHVAKYFANSIREDGLLAIATWGVVFAPGSAGTIQEVFQDACQNHYKTVGVVSPMIFLDTAYWTVTKPVYPLLAQLASGHEYAAHLSIHDDPEDVLRALDAYAQRRLKDD